MSQKEIDENLKKMYHQIINSDKTSEESKLEARYHLWAMGEGANYDGDFQFERRKEPTE